MSKRDEFWKGIDDMKKRIYAGEKIEADYIPNLRKKYIRYKIQRVDDLKSYPNSDEIIKSIQEAILKVNDGQPMHENDCFLYWHNRQFIIIDEDV